MPNAGIIERARRVQVAADAARQGLSGERDRELLGELMAIAEGWRMELEEGDDDDRG